MKKLKHEAELIKGAIIAGVKYAEGRGVVQFEPTDSASEKSCTSTGCWFMTKSYSHCLKIRSLKKPCGISSPSGTRSNFLKITRS